MRSPAHYTVVRHHSATPVTVEILGSRLPRLDDWALSPLFKRAPGQRPTVAPACDDITREALDITRNAPDYRARV